MPTQESNNQTADASQNRVADFNRFSIEMSLEDALSASHQGQCDEDVSYLAEQKRIANQFFLINRDDIRAELKEYGAWDDEELSDDEANNRRILWIAAGNIREEEISN